MYAGDHQCVCVCVRVCVRVCVCMCMHACMCVYEYICNYVPLQHCRHTAGILAAGRVVYSAQQVPLADHSIYTHTHTNTQNNLKITCNDKSHILPLSLIRSISDSGYTYVSMYVQTYICMYAHVCLYVHAYIHTYVHTHIHGYIYVTISIV